MDVHSVFELFGSAVIVASIWSASARGAQLRAAKGTIARRDGDIKELKRLLEERSKAAPWLAELVADLHWVQDEREARLLETKKHPGRKAAETLRSHAQEKKRLRAEKRLVDYRLALLESLYPWLREIEAEDAEEIAEREPIQDCDSTEDPVAKYLSHDEWARLSVTERNQRALDRYKKRAKTKWQIGREFERFLGHKFESQGYNVIYHGAIKGYDDFGRDLIMTDSSGKVFLIQCKYWGRAKVIPEAAVFQLLGSTVSYYIEQTGRAPTDLKTLGQCIQPCLFSSTRVAPRVREIAFAMGIKVEDTLEMKDWPMVKCNITPTGKRIYHLPMDQQYDRVKISRPGECYCWSVPRPRLKAFDGLSVGFSQRLKNATYVRPRKLNDL